MTGTWEQVVKELLEDQYFGRQINRSGYFKDQIAAITALHKEPVKQMEAIYRLVQNRMSWNGKYNIKTRNTVKKAFEERKGDVAEINDSVH